MQWKGLNAYMVNIKMSKHFWAAVYIPRCFLIGSPGWRKRGENGTGMYDVIVLLWEIESLVALVPWVRWIRPRGLEILNDTSLTFSAPRGNELLKRVDELWLEFLFYVRCPVNVLVNWTEVLFFFFMYTQGRNSLRADQLIFRRLWQTLKSFEACQSYHFDWT